MSRIEMGFRQIHLDFHTSPCVPDVGGEFDGKKFAAMVKAANVDSVTVFAKCHHGQLYYETKHPARHPGMAKGLDLLRRQVDALHAAGIRAPIYVSVQCDEFAANAHPEWLARNPDGTTVGPNPLQPGWQILDMSSPYLDYLIEQIEEILEKFAPVDGLLFDMCWNQPSVSKWAKAGMLKAGLNPDVEADRNTYAAAVSQDYMRRIHALCLRRQPRTSVYFNSRPLGLMRNVVASIRRPDSTSCSTVAG